MPPSPGTQGPHTTNGHNSQPGPVLTAAHATRKYRSLLMPRIRTLHHGAVAQLGERVVRNDEVVGSIPIGSTKLKVPLPEGIVALFLRNKY